MFGFKKGKTQQQASQDKAEALRRKLQQTVSDKPSAAAAQETNQASMPEPIHVQPQYEPNTPTMPTSSIDSDLADDVLCAFLAEDSVLFGG